MHLVYFLNNQEHRAPAEMELSIECTQIHTFYNFCDMEFNRYI